MEGRERGVWHPDLVGRVPFYAKTQESFDAQKASMSRRIREYNAAGITRRDFIPNGWTGAEINAIHRKAAKRAKKIVDKMIETGAFQPDCAEARIAMDAAVAIVKALDLSPKGKEHPAVSAREVNTALKTILEFTQKKPTTNSNVNVRTAEDWLDEIGDQ